MSKFRYSCSTSSSAHRRFTVALSVLSPPISSMQLDAPKLGDRRSVQKVRGVRHRAFSDPLIRGAARALADHHQTRIDADPRGELCVARLLVELGDSVEDRKGRAGSALGVVVVRRAD
jgi:hypothetical protein